MSLPSTPAPHRVLLGLSGMSASGKTTVARLLRDTLPLPVTILHEDDFFLPEAQLPVRASGLVDWDSAESLDVDGLVAAIRSLRDTGSVPAGFTSKEDRNAIGPSGISDETVQQLKQQNQDWWNSVLKRAGAEQEQQEQQGQQHKDASPAPVAEVFIIDGFLLFGESLPHLRDCFDLRLLLRATYAGAKHRREHRIGYATIEGFWTDPPGYWDEIVWPSYVREHKFMFEGGNVEAEPDGDILGRTGVEVMPGRGEPTVEQMLHWVLSRVKAKLEECIQRQQ